MATPPVRIAALEKLRAALFNHSYNPLNLRTGNKVLRQRLRGPAVASYYPPRVYSIRAMARMFPQWETYDEKEADRFDHIAITKSRGKGPPKKKRTAEESKKFGKRKSPVVASKPPPAS